FVGGQSTAVLELLSGRPDIPAAAWVPTAVKGLNGQPTLLSNAETFAQLASLARIGAEAYTAHGYPGHPGTVLITADPDSPEPYVAEVPCGTRLIDAVAPRWAGNTPILLGGFHGSWVRPGDVGSVSLSPQPERPSLGAGVITPLPAATCPIRYTEYVLRFRASESAGQCGPCTRGLPALSAAMTAVHDGRGQRQEVLRLADVVTGRGLCAHPDGTAALATSAITQFPTEVAEHEHGRCGWASIESDPWPTSALLS
ncbi:MAG: NADH-ubiquinone oxidoreductase-F iron-sulfur binding region domain-containing protein, partial [Angustibacter sp.]